MSVRVDTNTAASIAQVQPATIRQWVRRQLVTRHIDGIDVDELLTFVDTIRNTGKARGALLATHARHQTRRSA